MTWTDNIIYCLGITKADRVLVVTDKETEQIGDEAVSGVKTAAEEIKKILIEDYTQRPATNLPEKMVSDIAAFRPTASLYFASAKTGELPGFRRPLTNLLAKTLKCRHVNAPGITRDLVQQGLSADYWEIEKITKKIFALARGAKEIKVKNSEGTDIVAAFDPTLRWVPETGRILEQGDWKNLPAGEVFTCPRSIDGTFSARVLGDFLSGKYGYLNEPVTVTIQSSRFVSAKGGPEGAADDFSEYLRGAENNDRIGEFAIGTNIGLTKLIGNLLQDEKFPGCHMAFGHPYPDKTGASWDAPGHIDMISVENDIWIDGVTIMEKGRFVI